MPTILNADQIADVKFGGGTRRSKGDWERYVQDSLKGLKVDQVVTHVEEDFPDVKIEHVSHMLRLVLKENPELGKKWRVGKNDEHGIVLMPAA